jgi:hypothetical protein
MKRLIASYMGIYIISNGEFPSKERKRKGPYGPFPFYILLNTSFMFVERIYFAGLFI